MLQTETATFRYLSIYKPHLIISRTLGSDQNFSQNGAACIHEITVILEVAQANANDICKIIVGLPFLLLLTLHLIIEAGKKRATIPEL